MTRITGIRACVFDAYGTLFDFASAAARCQESIGDRLPAFVALWREKQLQYAWLRTLQGRHADFWNVTGDALDFAMETMGLRDPALRARLMDLYLELDAYPEVAAVLEDLKGRGYRMAILSNGTPAMLERLVSRAGIASRFDALLSIEAVGRYKTHPDVYRLATERFGCSPREILFVSSNGWDAWAASDFGFRVAWCNRTGAVRERLPGNPDLELRSLENLTAVLFGNR